MSKIASPQDLTDRLQSILRQASTGTPTRARLAEEIKQVAEDLEACEGQQKQAANLDANKAFNKAYSKLTLKIDDLMTLTAEFLKLSEALDKDQAPVKKSAKKLDSLMAQVEKAHSECQVF